MSRPGLWAAVTWVSESAAPTMEYVERTVGQGGDLGGALDSACFQPGRAGTFVPYRLRVTGGDGVSAQLIEKRAGLAVEDDSSIGGGDGAHGSQQGYIVKLHAVIGLVQLEGGAAGFHGNGDLVQSVFRAGVPGWDRHVEAVIDGDPVVSF